jgi:hypothetical protein
MLPPKVLPICFLNKEETNQHNKIKRTRSGKVHLRLEIRMNGPKHVHPSKCRVRRKRSTAGCVSVRMTVM